MPARPTLQRPFGLARSRRGLACLGLSWGLAAVAPSGLAAEPVTLGGVLGGRALLVIGQQPPKAVAVGDSLLGVRVLSVGRDEALIEQDGRRQTLRLGDAPVQLGAASAGPKPPNGKKITLTSDSSGHFKSQGMINGQVMQFMLDTGATVVAIGRPDADRMGLAYLASPQVAMSTANGSTPAWPMKLASLRVGDVEVYDVDAVVLSNPLPFVLLGNSFLSRFQMRQSGDQMVLDKKP
ncbi:retropepsin-like aspartic protease [Curvibacter sp. HBC61]|uniref:Retropepsin-like aspartic protease n=1 Tax=Curvibacter cyanobacteriorum TaxID=3026422 RepID=A0ABT5N5S7_9BURK|nr:retropepsin-like aspartic protease [Curvibacter sp. HBC61]MDD0840457.1 retropepsin-like aspartic protease [Curvibacter sp. HBC61]